MSLGITEVWGAQLKWNQLRHPKIRETKHSVDPRDKNGCEGSNSPSNSEKLFRESHKLQRCIRRNNDILQRDQILNNDGEGKQSLDYDINTKHR